MQQHNGDDQHKIQDIKFVRNTYVTDRSSVHAHKAYEPILRGLRGMLRLSM